MLILPSTLLLDFCQCLFVKTYGHKGASYFKAAYPCTHKAIQRAAGKRVAVKEAVPFGMVTFNSTEFHLQFLPWLVASDCALAMASVIALSGIDALATPFVPAVAATGAVAVTG